MDFQDEKLRSLNLRTGETSVSGVGFKCPLCETILSADVQTCPNDGYVVDRQPLAGESIAGKYKFIAPLGKGGMSTIYKAHDPLLNRTVAIKLLQAHLSQNEVMLKRFLQEGRAISQLNHPGIVRVHEFSVLPNGQSSIVMDYIDGQTLADAIKQKGRLSPSEVEHLTEQLCSALAHAHGRGVLHRDLKPSNVMLTGEGARKDRAVIVDFGIAKMKTEQDDTAGGLTATGEVFGSPLYMSPEQAKGMQVDVRSDLYSLGCLMYESLTGVPPFTGSNALETLFNKMNTDTSEITKKPEWQSIPPKLQQLLLALLQRDPGKRPDSAEAVLEYLRSPHPRQPLRLHTTATSSPQDRVRHAAMIAGVIMLMSVAAGLIYFGTQGPNVEPTTPPSDTSESYGTNASELDLSYAKYPGITDESLSKIQSNSLEKLWLRDNSKITDAGIAHLARFKTLKTLDIASTSISDAAGPSIAQLNNLDVLGVDNTRISDAFLKDVPPKVSWLSLAGTRVDADGIKNLSDRQLLSGMTLDGMQLTSEMGKNLESIPHLTKLYLLTNSVDSRTIGYIGGLKNLSELSMFNTGVDDDAIPTIAGMTELEYLAVDGTRITGDGLLKLASLKNLKTLRISEDMATPEQLATLKQQHPKCKIDIEKRS